MKATLAILGLALIAALAECKPTEDLLKKRVLEKFAARGRGDGMRNGEDKTEKEDDGEDTPKEEGDGDDTPKEEAEGHHWPYGWIEFATLYAKCESGIVLLESFGEYIEEALAEVEIYPKDSVLYHACPHAVSAGEFLMVATKEEKEDLGEYIKMVFPVLQCANLQAEEEELSLIYLLTGNDPKESKFSKEAHPLLELCDNVFKHLQAEVTEDIDQAKDEGEESEAKKSLREVLKHFRK